MGGLGQSVDVRWFGDSRDAIDHRNLLAAHYLNKGPAKACEACVVPRDAFKQTLRQA